MTMQPIIKLGKDVGVRKFATPEQKEIVLKLEKKAGFVPTIRLKRKKRGIAKYREKKTVGGRIVKTMTSLKTTAVLGATLATVLAPARALGFAKKAVTYVAKGTLGSPKKILLTTTVVGALGASPKLRGMVTRRIKDPFGHGRYLGEIVEDPSLLLPKEKQTTKEKIIELGKKAGVIGMGAGLVTAGVIGTKKVIAGRRKVRDVILSKVSGGMLGAPSGLITAPQETRGLDKPLGIEGQTPILQETTSIAEKPVKKRAYKPRRATKTPSVKQYVRVDIINRPITTGIRINNKRYLN